MSGFEEIDVKKNKRQIEDVIKQIIGVESCNVVITDKGTIEEVHIVAESSRTPKQLVRDIESSLMAELNIEIDHKKISIAQTKEFKGTNSKYRRLKITDVETKGNKTWINAKVSFSLGEKNFLGVAEGPNSGINKYKLLATAAVKAIEEILDNKVRLVIEDFTWEILAGQEIAIVVLSMVSENKIDTLVGACLAFPERDLAAIKAVLDALNRRLDII